MQTPYSMGLITRGATRLPQPTPVFNMQGPTAMLSPQRQIPTSTGQYLAVPQASIVRAKRVPAPTPPQALLSGGYPGASAEAVETAASMATAVTLPADAATNDSIGGPLEATRRVIGESIPEIGGACGFFCRNRYAFWMALVGAVLLVALAYYLSARFECRKWAREPAGAWLAGRASAGLAVPRFRSAGIAGDVEVSTQGDTNNNNQTIEGNDAESRGRQRRDAVRYGRDVQYKNSSRNRTNVSNHNGQPWSYTTRDREPQQRRPKESESYVPYDSQRAAACSGGGCRWELVEEPWFEPSAVQQVWAGPTPAFAPDDTDHIYDR